MKFFVGILKSFSLEVWNQQVVSSSFFGCLPYPPVMLLRSSHLPTSVHVADMRGHTFWVFDSFRLLVLKIWIVLESLLIKFLCIEIVIALSTHITLTATLHLLCMSGFVFWIPKTMKDLLRARTKMDDFKSPVEEHQTYCLTLNWIPTWCKTSATSCTDWGRVLYQRITVKVSQKGLGCFTCCLHHSWFEEELHLNQDWHQIFSHQVKIFAGFLAETVFVQRSASVLHDQWLLLSAWMLLSWSWILTLHLMVVPCQLPRLQAWGTAWSCSASSLQLHLKEVMLYWLSQNQKK